MKKKNTKLIELTYNERELAKYIYDKYITTANYGRTTYFEIDDDTFAELKEYYDSDLKKWTYNKIVKLFNKTLENENFRYYENEIQLDENHNLFEINVDIDEELYWFYADNYLETFEEEFGIKIGYNGRGGRHIVIENNVDNFINYTTLQEYYKDLRNDFIAFINSEEWKEEEE